MLDKNDELDSNDDYDRLKQQFLDGVSSRLDRLWQLYQIIVKADESMNLADLKSLHFELHKLSGASGAYEFSRLECNARKLESLVWSDIQDVKQGIHKQVIHEDYLLGLTAIEEVYHTLVR